MKKKEINYTNFPYSERPISLKAIHTTLYEMEENTIKAPCHKVTLDTLKDLIDHKGYYIQSDENGYDLTELGKESGFSTGYFMGKRYITCNKEAQKLVLETLDEYIKELNVSDENLGIKKDNLFNKPCYANDWIKAIRNNYGITGMDTATIKEIVLGFLKSDGYIKDAPELEKYGYLPTDKGNSIGIYYCKFTCDVPEVDLAIDYMIFLPGAAKFILEHFNEALKMYNENHSMD